jgi:NitT/TauT family transport system permease protein
MPAILLGTRTRDALSALVARAITPNAVIRTQTERLTIVFWWIAVAVALWEIVRPAVFPSPWDVLNAFPSLWFEDGLGQELLASLRVSLEALVLSACLALPLAYSARVPAVRPLAVAVAKLRFLSPSVFFVLLLFIAPSGHVIKVLMLTLGEACFLLTTMIGVVDAIPSERFDDCRTLRMSEGIATWYVVVRGTLHQAIDAIRDNNAMGWASLLMVEGIVRAEGGVGVLILNNEKHMNLSSVWAIALAILALGLLLDALIGIVRTVVCPYAVPR